MRVEGGLLSMIVKSASRRLAVTLPFFTLAAVLLGFFGRTTAPPRGLDPHGSPLVLIVTTSSLRPAFEALQAWSDEEGCPTLMVALDRDSAGGWMAQLGPICTQRGVTGLLLGGNRQLIPALSGPERSRAAPRSDPEEKAPRLIAVPTPSDGTMPQGMRVGRAVVDDLPQAWAFVEACRGSGRTLAELLDQTQTLADRDAGLRAALMAKALAPRRP
jgi:hypothetical protein